MVRKMKVRFYSEKETEDGKEAGFIKYLKIDQMNLFKQNLFGE